MARHIDIATAVTGDAVSFILGRTPHLPGPLLSSSTVVLDDEEITLTSIGIAIQTPIGIASQVDIATAVTVDALRIISARCSELTGPLLDSGAVILDDENIIFPNTPSLYT